MRVSIFRSTDLDDLENEINNFLSINNFLEIKYIKQTEILKSEEPNLEHQCTHTTISIFYDGVAKEVSDG